jgi:hypothetical protein
MLIFLIDVNGPYGVSLVVVKVPLLAKVDARVKARAKATAAICQLPLQDFVAHCIEYTLEMMETEGLRTGAPSPGVNDSGQ